MKKGEPIYKISGLIIVFELIHILNKREKSALVGFKGKDYTENGGVAMVYNWFVRTDEPEASGRFLSVNGSVEHTGMILTDITPLNPQTSLYSKNYYTGYIYFLIYRGDSG